MAIPTVEEASNKLQEILSQIALGISPSDRSRISDELVSYANPASSYGVPARPAYAELREIALTVSDELDRALTAAAIKRIRNRSAELARFVTAIKAVTDEAENNARDLKLKNLNEILQFSKKAVNIAKKARTAFEENQNQEGYAAIQSLIDEIENMRDNLAN